MTNKDKILNELCNDIEKLARILIICRDNIGWDEIISTIYITSDKLEFEDDYEAALKHEIDWLNTTIR